MGQKAVKDARDLLARYGRNGDSELAHVSPSERRLIAAWKGREDINPHTGLPEYFSFKKVLKGVAKAAGAAAGAYFGGPAGAAVGGALATKLTGGSWKSALGTGLLSGISAYGLQQSGAGDYLGIGSLGSGADLLGRTAAAAAPAAASGAAQAASGIDWKSLLPVAAVGIGALGAGSAKQPKLVSTSQTAQDTGPTWEVNTKPLDREYRSADDYYDYGQYGGEHEFYDEVNPVTAATGGAVRKFKYGGAGTTEGHGTAGTGARDTSKARDPRKTAAANKVKEAYSDPSRMFDTPANAKKVAEIMTKGDPTRFSGLKSRIPGPLTGITNILSGTPTPQDYVQTGAQVLGAVTGTPSGSLVGAGIGMGNAVNDVQALRDMGLLGGRTVTDPEMGRVDFVDGHGYSMGNPATDSRAPNTSGLGGGMTGGHGGSDGASVLSTLTNAFTPPPQAGAPMGIGSAGAEPVNTGVQQPVDGRKYKSAQDYYTYGQQSPEWQFFDQVNPVTAKAGGAQKKSDRKKLPPLGTEVIGVTEEGRKIYKNPDGSVSTERSVTVPRGDQWTNIPSMFGGKQYPDDVAARIMQTNYWIDPETGRPSQLYDTVDDAVRASEERSSHIPMQSQATGGTIKGKGSGQSDEIPALLSDNEHVVDASVISLLGEGSSDEGHRRMEKFKELVRKRAGMKNTKGIPPKQRGIGSMLNEVMR